MRIWHVYASPRAAPTNGVVRAIEQLSAAQRAIGLEVEVLAGTDDRHPQVPGGSVRGLRREAAARAAEAPPDVVHLHELFRPPHLGLWPLLGRIPYVVSTHGAVAPPNLRRYRVRKLAYLHLVERRSLRRAAARVALTVEERNQLIDRFGPDPRVEVIPNVADPALVGATPWEPPPGLSPVVTLARWDVRHKGLDRLAALAERLPDQRFVVHGAPCGNEPERLEALLEEAPTNLELAAAVDADARREVLRHAAAFALLSRWEGLSMALLEAMALGVPCLVSPEVARTLGPMPPVVALPSDEPEAAAREVRALLRDGPRCAAIGRAGRRWAIGHAGAEQVARASERLYRQVIDEAGALARRGPHPSPAAQGA